MKSGNRSEIDKNHSLYRKHFVQIGEPMERRYRVWQ